MKNVNDNEHWEDFYSFLNWSHFLTVPKVLSFRNQTHHSFLYPLIHLQVCLCSLWYRVKYYHWDLWRKKNNQIIKCFVKDHKSSIQHTLCLYHKSMKDQKNKKTLVVFMFKMQFRTSKLWSLIKMFLLTLDCTGLKSFPETGWRVFWSKIKYFKIRAVLLVMVIESNCIIGM